MPQIDKVIAKQAPTLLDASKANELIGYINGLLQSKGDGNIKVIAEDSGRLVISSDSEEGSDIEFNGSVLICINGSPYYINIPYDADRGAYAASEGADFPIEEPA